MTDYWSYNGIRITVVDLKEQAPQIIPKLQPLNGGTIYQTFGYENDSISLQCLVVGYEDKASLKALARTGLYYTLSGVGINLGSFYLDKITFDWEHSYKQTFRTDKSNEEMVFKTVMELSKV